MRPGPHTRAGQPSLDRRSADERHRLDETRPGCTVLRTSMQTTPDIDSRGSQPAGDRHTANATRRGPAGAVPGSRPRHHRTPRTGTPSWPPAARSPSTRQPRSSYHHPQHTTHSSEPPARLIARAVSVQNGRSGAARTVMPTDRQLTPDRRVGARSPGSFPSLSVTLVIGITSRPNFDPAVVVTCWSWRAICGRCGHSSQR